MRWRSRSLLVVVLLLVAGLSVVGTGSVAAQQVNVAATDLSGDGTQADPYVITNASELQAMEDDLDAHYELGSDIDGSNTELWNTGNGFDPVGQNYNTPFQGTIDGTGHTINNLTVNRSNDDRVGLIGVNDDRGKITNITIADVRVTGGLYTGGIVGSNDGKIVSSSVTGAVTGSNNVGGLAGSNGGYLNESDANVSVDGEVQVGGLVGANFANTVYKSHAMGPVDGGSRVGGLVGSNYRTVVSSYATGSVTGNSKIGGLVGYNQKSGDTTTIFSSYSVGKVTGTDTVGGLVGYNNATVRDSYWDEQTTGQATSAGGNATGLTTAQMTGQAAETNMTGLNFDSVWQTTPDDYPVLSSITTDGDNVSGSGFVDVDASDLAGDGTKSDPYVITNASELQAIEDDLDAHYELGNDIDASNTAQWNNRKGFEPIGFANITGPDRPFHGSLDGNNHTVTKITIDRPKEVRVGVIGYANSTATIHDISVQNATLNGWGITGGLVGLNSGRIKRATVTGEITGSSAVGGLIGVLENGIIQNATAIGSVDGSQNVGGLVGAAVGTTSINNSTSAAVVHGSQDVGGLVGGVSQNALIKNTTATGRVNGSRNVGGLVGDSEGLIKNSRATGEVDGVEAVGGLAGGNGRGATIRNAISTARTNGSTEVGGFVGLNRGGIKNAIATGDTIGSNDVGGFAGNQTSTGTIENSYWDEQTTGQATSAGSAVGLTTEQMTGQAARTNMTGLDFDSIWQTQPNDYPVLRSQINDDDTGGEAGGGDTSNATASVTSENVTVPPGKNVTIQFNVTNTGEVNSSYILNLSLPTELTAVNYIDSGGEQQANESKWLWETITPGETVKPTVTVQTPSDSTGTYTIDATVLTDEDIVATTETTVTTETVSVPEAIDTDNNNEIGDMEILTAIEYWQTREPVPGTDGERIGDFEILELIEQWRYNSEIYVT